KATTAPPVAQPLGQPNPSAPGTYNPYGALQPVSIKPVVIGPEDLPRQWLGYGMLDALVIDDAPLTSLDEERVSALRAWVGSGGTLIVMGGADFPGLRRSGLDALLPVDVTERRAVSAVPDLTSTYGDFSASGEALLAIGAVRIGGR